MAMPTTTGVNVSRSVTWILEAAAGLAGPFLERRAKEIVAKGDAGEVEFVEFGHPFIGVDKRCAIDLEWFRRSAPL